MYAMRNLVNKVNNNNKMNVAMMINIMNMSMLMRKIRFINQNSKRLIAPINKMLSLRSLRRSDTLHII
jgi:hypothetical protein